MRKLPPFGLHTALGIATSLFATTFAPGCGKDLDIDPPVDLADYVIAQFDPSNPIPVFNLVTTPTALVQNPDGTLNVPLAECEQGTVKQCAAFAGGWAANSPVTLFFSGQVDPASVAGGLKFLKLTATGPVPVEFTVLASNAERPAPPEACKTQFNYEDAQVPAGIQVVIQPSAPLDPATPYVVFVESYDGGGVQALEAPNKVVQPSALFYIMNQPRESAPVCVFDADGNLADTRAECNTPGVDPKGVIVSPLLRGQVQAAVINQVAPGQVWSTLTDDEKAQVSAAVAGQVPNLARLYGYFDRMINGLAAAGAIDRSRLVFGTLWTTENLPAANVVFDPANSEVPFPNTPLLTMADQTTSTGVKVSLPVPTTPGIQQLLIQNLNTLDGFALFGTQTLTIEGDVDFASLLDALHMYELDADGAPVGSRVSVTATISAHPTRAGAHQLRIRPNVPLKQSTHYAVGITKEVRAANGGAVGIAATYNLLKDPNPAVQEDGTARAALVPILQCSTVPTTGMLATPEQVNGTAGLIENQLNRARWQAAFQAFEQLTPAIPRTEMLIAWTYTTQNLTNLVDIAGGALSAAGWEQLLAPNGVERLAPVDLNGPAPGESIVGTASVAAFLQVVERFCIGLLCQTGSIEDEAACATATECLAGTETDPQTCSDARAAVEADLFCTVAKNLLTSNVREIRRYDMATYKLVSGNPLNPTQGAFDPARFMQPLVRTTPVWVVLPQAAQPTAGYPVTIFQHGLTREKEDGFFIANSLAGGGQATVLMDAIYHGERVSDLVDNATGAPCVDSATTLPNIDPDLVDCSKATNTCTARQGGQICDGLPDPSGTGAIAVSPFTIRDGLRQATVDHLTLIRAIRAETTLLADLDPDTISYAGQSLGAIMGANLLPYVPDLNAAALNVGGGSIVHMLFLNPTFSGRLNPALVSAGVCELIDSNNPAAGCLPTPAYLQFLSVVGWVVEPGDPITTSIGVRDARPILGMPSMNIPAFGNQRILMQMAIPDGVIPNPTSRALGGVYGFNPADNSATSHFQTYNIGGTDCHGFVLLPNPAVCGAPGPEGQDAFENALCATLGAQRQIAGFLASGGVTVPGRVFDPVPGILTCPNNFELQ